MPSTQGPLTSETIYAIWAPPEGIWSLWARPVLFAQMTTQSLCHRPALFGQMMQATFPQPPSLPEVAWAPDVTSNTVLVVDLPGEAAVRTGLALAGRGHRPVPLFNGCTGPGEVVDQEGILHSLVAGAGILTSLQLPLDAPPAFLLDAWRLRVGPGASLSPGAFDNRWIVFPQDFPSARFVLGRGVTQALLVQRGQRDPQDDLAHVLRRWQDAKITIHAIDLADARSAAPITVVRPRSYRAISYRADAALGLRHSGWGGFGDIVPQPSHG